MISTQYINLNMVPSGVMPVLHCSQYDVGRPLGVVIYNGSESVDLSGYTVTIEGTRTDRTPVTAGVTTDGNIGVFTTTPTMTNENDTYRAKVVLTDNAGRVSSLAFVMCVDEKTMDENAEEIEEDASLYQQYTGTVQTIIAQIRGDLAAEITARQNAISAEASARQAADNTLQSNINAEASARAAADAVLQGQIDNFVQLPSGSTTADAELMNIRVGADGVTYNTAGDAVRANDSLLKSQLQAINNGTAQFGMGFVQGVRYSGSPTTVSTSSTRCTSQSAIHLRASDELEVIVPSGLKLGVVTTLGTDSGWKTSTFSIKPIADCDAYINAAKTSDAAVTPSDITGVVINYTDNSSRISILEQDSKDLADALPVITGNEPLDFDPNAWINTSGTTVIMSDGYPVYNASTSSTYELSIVPCAKGDVFTLNVVGGIQTRSYAIIDSEGNILDKGRENQTLTDFEIIMPEGAAFLILQDKKPTTRQSYKGRLLVKSYQNLFDDVYRYTGNQRLLNIYRLRYVNLTGTTISMDSDGFPVLTYANDVDVTIEPCTAGDVFTVSASGGITKRAYGFVSSTGEVLEKSGEAVSLTNYVVVAPSNSAYFISHNMFGNTMPTGWEPNCYKGEYIQNTIEKHNYGFDKILSQIYAN